MDEIDYHSASGRATANGQKTSSRQISYEIQTTLVKYHIKKRLPITHQTNLNKLCANWPYFKLFVFKQNENDLQVGEGKPELLDDWDQRLVVSFIQLLDSSFWSGPSWSLWLFSSRHKHHHCLGFSGDQPGSGEGRLSYLSSPGCWEGSGNHFFNSIWNEMILKLDETIVMKWNVCRCTARTQWWSSMWIQKTQKFSSWPVW